VRFGAVEFAPERGAPAFGAPVARRTSSRRIVGCRVGSTAVASDRRPTSGSERRVHYQHTFIITS